MLIVFTSLLSLFHNLFSSIAHVNYVNSDDGLLSLSDFFCWYTQSAMVNIEV